MQNKIFEDKKRLLVIDGHSLLHRAFHALPPLTTKKGELVNAIYGFLLILFRAISQFQPDFVVATFDFPAPTFRHEKFKEYKATRPKIPPDLSQQIPKIKEILKTLNIPIFEKKGFEADDIIGTIAKLAPRKQVIPEIETIILSGDLDTLQLVDNFTKVYTPKKGIKETILYDRDKIQERYGLLPSQLVDLRALKGDSSDNIPGIPGIGQKTAILLLQKFGNIENLYQELEKNSEKAQNLKPRIKNLLLKYKETAFFSKALAEINKNVRLDFDLKKCNWKSYNKEKVIQLFKELEFNSLISRLPK